MVGERSSRVAGGLLLGALLLTGCASDPATTEPSDTASSVSPDAGGETPTEPSSPDAQQDADAEAVDVTVQKRVRVAPGRRLSAQCYGSGTPVVIYLHGAIQPSDTAVWAHSPEMRDRLGPETTYCEYERTNVGASSTQKGPIPVSESVADLRAVIEGLELETPVVLLGGSFGGLIAYTYAGTHPQDVAGVVLLDPTLPWELDLERDFMPKSWWLTEDSWKQSTEQIDPRGSYAIGQAALPGIPEVPGTIIVTKALWAPEGKFARPFKQAVRDQQAALIHHFEPHKTLTVDAPHAMIPDVPDEIAAEVMDIVKAARKTGDRTSGE